VAGFWQNVQVPPLAIIIHKTLSKPHQVQPVPVNHCNENTEADGSLAKQIQVTLPPTPPVAYLFLVRAAEEYL
jgi:hypothetical protein